MISTGGVEKAFKGEVTPALGPEGCGAAVCWGAMGRGRGHSPGVSRE